MDKMRPAITLFITLAVVVAMLSIVAITFGYLSKARQKAEDKSALIEANLIYADASNAVSKFVGKKPSVGRLKNIYDIPLTVAESKGPFRMLVACVPARAAIPISWLSTKGGAKREAKLNLATLVYDDIALKYRFRAPEKLKEMLSEAINSKQTLNFNEASRLKRAKSYFGLIDFKKVLTNYFLQERDDRVFKPNWNNYFSFGKEYNQIDGEFLSSKLISAIFSIDEQIVEEDFKSGHLKEFLYNNGADMELFEKSKLFAKGAVDALSCSVNYSFGKGSYAFKFNYISGKVEGFEFIR